MNLAPSAAAAGPTPGGTAVCTVVSKNYLANARALQESLARFHPDVPFFVLLVDRVDGHFDPAAEPYTLLTTDDLDNIRALPSFLFKYTILELNTAVKPFLFERLFERYGLKKLIYFDPDILVFSPLDQLLSLLDEHAAVVTPHLTRPIDDDKTPGETQILLSGSYNLGFLGMSDRPSTGEFLRWWQRRLYEHCVVDLASGYFVDQRWIDLAPSMFPGFYNLTDPRYNIAYWNFHERGAGVEMRPDGSVLLNGEPVVFFHFSGYSTDKLEGISRHQNRFRLSDLPGLRPVYEHYRDRLMACGHAETRKWPYAFGFFDNGIRVWDFARRVYRELEDRDARFPDPFATADGDSFYAWLRERVPSPLKAHRESASAADAFLPRLWWEFYQTQPDLHVAYPDPFLRDRASYYDWIRKTLPAVFRDLDARLMPSDEELEEARRAASANQGRLRHADTLAAATAREKVESRARVSRPVRRVLGAPFKLLLRGRNRELLDRIYYWALGPKATAVLWNTPGLFVAGDSGPGVMAELSSARRNGVGGGSGGPALHGVAGVGDSPWAAALSGGAGASGRDWGVNVVGYLTGEFGVGETGRGWAKAAMAAGAPVALNNVVAPEKSSRDRTFAESEFREDNPYAVNLLVLNADMTAHTMRLKGPENFGGGRYNVGYWAWELPEFPEEFWPSFSLLDEVWVGSAFNAASIGRVSPIPVVRMSYPVQVDPAAVRPERTRFGVPEGAFAFAFTFDFQSFAERKNPYAVVEAFRRAFGEGSKDAVLVLKSMNGSEYPEEFGRMREATRGLNAVLLDTHLTREETLGLIAGCDALVSLHRAEGLGLGMLEAMALGKPVIATDWSGNADFMSVANSLPVRYKLVELDRDHGPYKKGNRWAEPDMDHAAEQMRLVAGDRALAARIGAAAAAYVRENHTTEAAAREVRARLERIRAQHGGGGGA